MPSDNSTHFYKAVPLDKRMSIDDAVSHLAAYHQATAAAITQAFIGLKDNNTHSVHFRESINSGYPCIAMVGENENGSQKRSNLIFKETGQPQAHCG